MPITYTIDYIEGITVPSDVFPLTTDALNNIAELTPTVTKDGENVSSYVIANGDTAYPTTMFIRSGLQKRATGFIRHIAMTINGWASSTDDVSGEVVKKPVGFTLSFNVPADLRVEPDDLLLLVQGFVSLTLMTPGGDWNSAKLAKAMFGVTDIL